MSTNDYPQSELMQWLECLLDGEIGAEDHARLESLLQQDSEARGCFLDYMRLHGWLQWDATGLLDSTPEAGEPDRTALPVPPLLSELESGESSSWSLFSVSWLMVCVLAVLAASSLTWHVVGRQAAPQPEQQSLPLAKIDRPESIAVLRYSDRPVWEDSTMPTAPGQAVPGGRLKLSSGVVQIETFSGTLLTLKGPCDLELGRDHRAHLHRGDLIVKPLRAGANLLLLTPAGEFFHVGTEYGVRVELSGVTETYVYDGTVGIRRETGGAGADSARMLGKGASMRIEADGWLRDLNQNASQTFRRQFMLPKTANAPFRPRMPALDKDGFTVRLVKSAGKPITNLADADDLLGGRISSSRDITTSGVESSEFLNGPSPPPYTNVFFGEQAFPGGRPYDKLLDSWDEDFAVRVTATLVVSDVWQYSFLVNVDDGARLRIDGRDVTVDNGIHPPQVSIGVLTLMPGKHTLEVVYYNHGAFARLELGVAVGDTTQNAAFKVLKLREKAEKDSGASPAPAVQNAKMAF